MSRTPFDTWSKREQLCLASAVSCSGDQNWITVSRTLKSVCGNGHTRPADWYSQKNCALQYGHLLESVETTKRKKRTNENSGFSSPATVAVETPTEILLRRLTEERQLEIKTQMRRDQELYSKVQREIEALQANELSEQQLQQMWQEIEKDQDAKRIDEMKLENRMREREQRKKDTAGNWRNSSGSGASRRSNLTADTTSVDMDVEDIAGNNPSAGNNKQQTVPPAPLLTSLLKSPGGGSSNNNNNGNNATSPTGSTPGAGVARATAAAPTITSLLTSGSSAMPKQPAVILKNPSDPAFMTRPISGPPSAEVAITARSPSQAAPTLSMLLEKNKLAAAATATASETPAKAASADADAVGVSQPQAEVEKAATAAGEEGVDESDEADEQQLLEVFKTIKNIIEDIDIDMVMDEDILKDVDNVISPAAAAPAKAEVVDFEDKLDTLKRDDSRKSSKSPTQTKALESVVVGSSDDSNDNIPLAAVASQESNKERSQHSGESPTTATATDEAVAEELNETITIASSSSEENARETAPAVEMDTGETAAQKSPAAAAETNAAENNNNSSKTEESTDAVAQPKSTEISKAAPKEDAEKATTEATVEPKISTSTATSSSVQDTDEESSSLTDSSKADEPTRSVRSKPTTEHKAEAEPSARQTPPRGASSAVAPAPVAVRPPLLRKLPHRDRSESPMVDDDTTTASDQSTARSSTRRRCSSTPLIDSIPNSPASSEHTDDRRETRGASKKLFVSIYSTLLESKYASPFRRPFLEEHPHKQAELCLRQMDLPSIKRNIDSGQLRSLSELQRDLLLMCHNLLLIYKPNTTQHKTARQFMQECRSLKEFAAVSSTPSENSSAASSASSKADKDKERTPAGNKARSGSRKSQRHH